MRDLASAVLAAAPAAAASARSCPTEGSSSKTVLTACVSNSSCSAPTWPIGLHLYRFALKRAANDLHPRPQPHTERKERRRGRQSQRGHAGAYVCSRVGTRMWFCLSVCVCMYMFAGLSLSLPSMSV
jgi:hypothetical protein